MEQKTRRVLGKETILTVDGEDKEIIVYSMGFLEKLQLIKKFTTVKYINGYSYKEVDEVSIMMEILSKCIEGVTIHELDFNAQDIYEKYFKPKDNKEQEKKDDTSTITHSVTK